MQLGQHKVGADLNLIQNEEVRSELQQQLHGLQLLERNLSKANQLQRLKLKKIDSLQQMIVSQQPALNEKYAKLCILAKKYKVAVDESSRDSQLVKQYHELGKEVKKRQEAIDMMTHACRIKEEMCKTQIAGLRSQINQRNDEINELEQAIQNLSNEIREQ